ncbi:MAG TPA: tetratricopeptide repeat protein, partial [Steroidobacteraceae bacterium]|nr:tetratricopeptide repeat protein [Steroidobacteraceae bacterium]
MQRPTQVEQGIRAALAAAPNSAQLHDELGNVLTRQGRHAEAIVLFERALVLDPSLPHTRKRLADALVAAGRESEADRFYAEYIAQDPDRRVIAEGVEHLQAGRKEEAIAAFEGVLRRVPDHIDAMRMLALALGREPRGVGDAEALLLRVTERAPEFAEAWINLAALYLREKKWVKSAEAFLTATKLEPTNGKAWAGLGDALAQGGHPEQGVEAYQTTVNLDPSNAYAQMGLAHVLKAVGRQEQSVDAYRTSIALRPDFGEAYWSLANLKTFRFGANDIAAMKSQVDGGALTPEAGVHFSFALGKAFEDLGDYDSAWHWYHSGNQRQRPLVAHDPLIMDKQNAAIIETFSAEFLRAREGQGYEGADPIFIVG